MFEPETLYLIGVLAGLMVGYVAGFFVAMKIYRSPTWPQ